MSALARKWARILWFGMLWLMRRNYMRRLQSASIGWLPASIREKARRALIRQNAFARRIGLPLTTVTLNIFFASIALTFVWFACLWLFEHGILSVPDNVREKAAANQI